MSPIPLEGPERERLAALRDRLGLTPPAERVGVFRRAFKARLRDLDAGDGWRAWARAWQAILGGTDPAAACAAEIK